jgi:phosphatidylinositol alpha-1,6-mannosyltransferase
MQPVSPRKILFLYLKAFSSTGGIEKFNRCLLKALEDLSAPSLQVAAASPYEAAPDNGYFPASKFLASHGNKIAFVLRILFRSKDFDTFIIGHINLAILGYLIKVFRPTANVIVIAHGIEVWNKQRGFKLKILERADWIFAVSNFTKDKIHESNPCISLEKIRIFPNTIDPHFPLPATFEKPDYLLKRYHFSHDDKILLTINRLSTTEKYKRYDQIIKTLAWLKRENKNLKYLLCGKSDESEERRIHQLIQEEGLQNQVLLTGYVEGAELVDHYLLGDVFVMPSKKEGFGIVFIEALACGRPVIAGAKDGSVDALLNGKLGKLIDPDSLTELKDAIEGSLTKKDADPLTLQAKVLSAYRFENYRDRLREYLFSL